MARRIRWGIRARDVLIVALLTVVVVAVTTAVHVVQLVRVSQDSAGQEADTLAHEVYAVAREELSRSPGPASPGAAAPAAPEQVLAASASLRALLEAHVGYSQGVVYGAVTDRSGRLIVGTDGAGRALASSPPTFDQLRALSPWHRILAIYRPNGLYEATLPLDLDGRPFATIHMGMATGLIRRELGHALARTLWLSLAALPLALGAGLVVAQLTLAPVRRLRTEIGRMREGRVEPGEPVHLSWEFDDLASDLRMFGREVAAERLRLLAEKSSLEQLVDHLEDGVLLLNRSREVLFFNRACEPLLGLALEQAFGEALRDLLPGDSPVAALLERVAATGSEVRHVHLRQPRNGGAADYLASAFPVADPQAGDAGYVALFEDLESVEILRNLVRYGARMTSLTRLSSGMVHELRNPLNAMALHVALLGDVLDPAPERAAESLRLLDGEIHRLDGLLQDFSRFSRPEELRLAEVDLVELLRDVVELVRPEAEEAGVRVQLDLGAEPQIVSGDAERLRQVFVNLVRNAFQAMPDGGDLAVHCEPEPPLFVLASLEDTGVGIEPEDLEKIFQLYYSTKDQGSGLGLFMVHRIVQQHGGMVEASSRPGRGTRMSVHLPVPGLLESEDVSEEAK